MVGGVLFGVIIRLPGRQQMADPAQKPPAPNPKTGRNDEPKDAPYNPPIINLPHTGQNQTQYSRHTGISHKVFSPVKK